MYKFTVIHQLTGELTGACIAGKSGYCDNDFSEIGEIAVKPSYRGRGIAKNMLKRVLTNLKEMSPAAILCVTMVIRLNHSIIIQAFSPE
ncbi:MAG: GNAT family N-acetyltransferase [Pseudomonadota bacterium]